jgi:hypothetical protein
MLRDRMKMFNLSPGHLYWGYLTCCATKPTATGNVILRRLPLRRRGMLAHQG